MPKIFSNIKKLTFYLFIIWVVLSIATIAIHHYGMTAWRWIDIPTHLVAGIALAAIIADFFSKSKFKEMLPLALIIFVGWEIIEIKMSGLESSFYLNLFMETRMNQLRDLAMDFLGLLIFTSLLMSPKKVDKKPTLNLSREGND